MSSTTLTTEESRLALIDAQRRQIQDDEALLREIADAISASISTKTNLTRAELLDLWIGVADRLALCHECGEERDPDSPDYCPSCAADFNAARAEDARLEATR